MGLPQRTNQASWRESLCGGFRTPAATNISPRTAAGVRKPPRDETAGRGTYWAVPRAQLWGFGRGRATAEVSSEGRLSGEDGDAGRGDVFFWSPGWCVGEDQCGCCAVKAASERPEALAAAHA